MGKRRLPLLAAALTLGACGQEDPLGPRGRPEQHVVSVVTSTSGPGPWMSHGIFIGEALMRTVAPNDSVGIPVTTPGPHEIRLQPGLDCRAGYEPQIIQAGGVARFAVTCVGGGVAHIVTSTEGMVRLGRTHGARFFNPDLGPQIDPWDAHTVAIGPNDSLVVRLTSGAYGVSFAPAPNCYPTSEREVTFETRHEQVTRLAFSARCVPEGQLTAVVSATGGDIPGSFPLKLTGDVHPFTQYVSAVSNSSVHDWLSAGDWVGELLPPFNCTVASANPVAFSVEEGRTRVVSYQASCVPYKGTLRVTITTGGTRLPRVFVLGVDRECHDWDWEFECSGEYAVPTNGTWAETFPEGEHRVGIFYVPSNCTLSPAGEFAVTVTASEVTDVAFTAMCQ